MIRWLFILWFFLFWTIVHLRSVTVLNGGSSYRVLEANHLNLVCQNVKGEGETMSSCHLRSHSSRNGCQPQNVFSPISMSVLNNLPVCLPVYPAICSVPYVCVSVGLSVIPTVASRETICYLQTNLLRHSVHQASCQATWHILLETMSSCF